MKSVELWHDLQKSWLEPSELSSPSEDQLLIRSMYSLISAGTERVLTNQMLDPELAHKMAVLYQKGTLSQRFTYGYSLVGEVISEGNLNGKYVHVMHPHQDVVLVKRDDVRVLPEGMDPKLATLISNMETAVNAVWDAQIELGDRVLIQGYGTIGALVASTLQKHPGLNLHVHEIDPLKSDLIAAHGLGFYDGEEKEFDVVFNTTSSEQALKDAFRLTRLEGTVIELSWYGNRQVNLSLGENFHYGRKRLICSQVSHIPYRKQPIWNYKNRKDLVIRLLQEINPIYLLGNEINFQDTPEFYDKLRAGEIKELSTIINYR
ncbi:MAG: zinc-binding alcohol dehydrogenase [Cytophagales bacterium]|nr:zinc-binding alcohol dehydrogenase [Cytophagales bacterium]